MQLSKTGVFWKWRLRGELKARGVCRRDRELAIKFIAAARKRDAKEGNK